MSYSERCCFTGHRPERLPWRYHEEDIDCLALKYQLMQEICLAYDQGKRHFITGMALGVDMYCAEILVSLQKQYEGIVIESARPCITQADRWPLELQRRYYHILDQCNYETMVQHNYSPACMMRRNRYMVDHASLLIAVYDGNPKGGTAQTIAYAMKRGIEVKTLWVPTNGNL